MRYTFNEIVIPIQKRYKFKHNLKQQHNGFDTETYKGRVKLICSSFYKSHSEKEDFLFIDSFEDILNFLTRKQEYKSSFNWFFNIKYDFESIIKWLNKSELEEIYNKRSIKLYDAELFHIDKKYFNIKRNNCNYHFFDINNFLETSLNKASKTYLNKEKLDIIDSSRLNLDLNYWEKEKENILKYCLMDAKLTRMLANKFWVNMYKNLKFYPKRPYSKGHYAQEYFLKNCYIPTINNLDKEILEYAYNSYYGGRFELLKRGYFKDVYTYDIKSAYPYQMVNLLDVSSKRVGLWEKVDDYDDTSKYGFYNCRISFFSDNISPFMQKLKGLNVYPSGIFEQYLTQQEIEFIRKNFQVDIEIIDGYCFYPIKEKYPLKEEIERLYQLKETAENKQDRMMYKIVLNSLYGKFIQTIGKKAGKLFNPIWASIITANTRLMLMEYALKNPDDIIGFSTDAIQSKQPLNLPIGQELGKFELDFKGEGIFIMSDIYTIWNNEDEKSRFRGWKKIGMNNQELKYDLRVILNHIGEDTTYTYTTERPIHLGEALKQINVYSIEDINLWKKIIKEFNINGDRKRIWNRDFKNGYDALEKNISSAPLMIV